MSICTFTDTLPLELRREIYRLVLQREQAIKLDKERASQRFDFSLFRVSRSVAAESREVFFEINTLHIRPQQIWDLIRRYGRRIRILQIEADLVDDELQINHYLDAASTLLANRESTPKLKTVIFECKGLHLTVRQLVERLATINRLRNGFNIDVERLRCIKVGTYILTMPELSQEWKFSYSLLASLWEVCDWQDSSNFPSPQDSEAYFHIRGPTRTPAWVDKEGHEKATAKRRHNAQGLASQIARYGDIEALLPSLKPQRLQLEVLRRFELFAEWRIKKPVLQDCLKFAGLVDLRDVRTEHGENLLEWATELLAPNTKDFAAEIEGGWKGTKDDEVKEAKKA